MANASLADRVTALEKIVNELRSAPPHVPGPHDWKRTIGMFSGDEVMKRIDAEALAYREADRAKARQRFAKQRKRKT